MIMMVAGPGLEPGLRGYEPRELPLLNPAIKFLFLKKLVRLVKSTLLSNFILSLNNVSYDE